MLRPKSTGGGVAMLSGSGASHWERYSWPKYCHRVHQATLSRTTATPGSPTSSAYVFRRVNAIRSAEVDPGDAWPVTELVQSQAAAVKGRTSCVRGIQASALLCLHHEAVGQVGIVEVRTLARGLPRHRKQARREGLAQLGGERRHIGDKRGQP